MMREAPSQSKNFHRVMKRIYGFLALAFFFYRGRLLTLWDLGRSRHRFSTFGWLRDFHTKRGNPLGAWVLVFQTGYESTRRTTNRRRPLAGATEIRGQAGLALVSALTVFRRPEFLAGYYE